MQQWRHAAHRRLDLPLYRILSEPNTAAGSQMTMTRSASALRYPVEVGLVGEAARPSACS